MWESEEGYFSAYDRFQNNSRYRALINWAIDELEESESIIDIGAGTGNLSKILLQKGKRVGAIDTDKVALEILIKKCQEHQSNLQTFNGDFLEFSVIDYFEENVDSIVSLLTFPFPPHIERVLEKSYEVLKPGGKFVMAAWLPDPNLYQNVFGFIERELGVKGDEEWEELKLRGIDFVKAIQEINVPAQNYLSILSRVGFINIEKRRSLYPQSTLLPLVGYKPF